ncbi:DNA-binding transcriptional regulator [Fructobacillus cardui]|uniref:MarR family (MarR) n=1 Tax=Fructobacillus cardui TaxID=2893170 RepID=A0ABM9MX12_9LACO|nr:DNA-binding transcriptional regulator [Fructobacillus cardui]CAK1246198.1 DNA-binding transcriptional regulator [Fructobacillus cardui]CAK1251448.1 DNA-binding transcriptional regulator [Fructobacillus cardui]
MIELEVFRQMGSVSRRATKEMNLAASQYQLENNLFLYLIRIVEHEGLTQSDLAELIQVDKTTLSRSLKKLNDRGYIDKVTDAQNKNYKQLYPTQKARDRYEVLAKLERQYIKGRLATLSATELTDLNKILNKILHS